MTRLNALGLQVEVREFRDSTATAQEAAEAIGTSVERIVKSLVFATSDGQPLLVLVSGANRVDLGRLSDVVGQPVGRANANQVRQATGFAIGGVPPVGHETQLPVYVDADLLQYDQVWAAAGTPNSVFAITPDDLVRVASGQVVAVKAE